MKKRKKKFRVTGRVFEPATFGSPDRRATAEPHGSVKSGRLESG